CLPGDLTAVAMLLRARNCTTPRAGLGRQRAVSAALVIITGGPCCATARLWAQGDKVPVPRLSRARNSTTRRAGPGQSRAVLTPPEIGTRRLCCPTARS